MQMRVKMQQPAYKCEKMQMRALFVHGPIPGRRRILSWKLMGDKCDLVSQIQKSFIVLCINIMVISIHDVD